jgi:hypothetical protein
LIAIYDRRRQEEKEKLLPLLSSLTVDILGLVLRVFVMAVNVDKRVSLAAAN